MLLIVDKHLMKTYCGATSTDLVVLYKYLLTACTSGAYVLSSGSHGFTSVDSQCLLDIQRRSTSQVR
jgi:hypothetical protein